MCEMDRKQRERKKLQRKMFQINYSTTRVFGVCLVLFFVYAFRFEMLSSIPEEPNRAVLHACATAVHHS